MQNSSRHLSYDLLALVVALVAFAASPITKAEAQPAITGVSGGAQGLVEDVTVGRDSVVGSMEAEWIDLTGRGFRPDAIVRLRATGVDAEITSEQRIRYRSPEELSVWATFGTEADRWTIEVMSGGVMSAPYPFYVVPPRPVIQHVEIIDGGVRRRAYTVRLVGPAYAETSEVLVDGQPVPTDPIKSSPYSGALTVGLKATVSASAFRNGEAQLQVRTLGSAGGGLSDPATAVLPHVPWHARPELWLSVLGVIFALGFVSHRRGVRHAQEQARKEQLELEVAERTADLEEKAEALDAALATQATLASDLQEAADQRARAFAGVTHDLRTPLSVVLASLDSVLDREHLSTDDRAEVEAARRATGQLTRLSASLGEAAQHEAGRFLLALSPLDIVALARDVVAEQSILLGRLGISACVEAKEGSWVRADAWAVRRILSNLLDNAAKFTSEGGAITVSVHRGYVNETVEIAVRDTGPGFKPAFIRQAFEPYVQDGGDATQSALSREGIGLGLSVVRDLAERMRGGVRAEPGPGGTVVVTLPAAHPDPEHEAMTPEPSDRPRVLVAEDDDELRGVLVRLLSSEFDVEAVADGRKAFEAARRRRPAVILSDIMMPGLDGVGLVRSLRAEPWGESTPVILVTALSAPEHAVGAFAAGADDYVAKPFDRAVLLARVRRLVGGRPETDSEPALVGPNGQPLSPDDARLVEAVRAAVEGNLSDPDFDVEALGRAVGLSKAQLGRRLRDALDVSPAKYVERVRLDHAAGMVRAGGRLVKEVAGAVGYRDVRTFTRAFKRRFGASPSAWGG